MASRICITSDSVSWLTRRSGGIATLAQICLAKLSPMPWI
jgi:hypothetical protein